MILSPRKIILGGGVMHQEQLFPLIREKVKEMIGGYLNTKELAGHGFLHCPRQAFTMIRALWDASSWALDALNQS